MGYEDVFFKTADGKKIHGWFLQNNASDKVILYFHGNAGNLSYRLDTIGLLYSLPANIFAIDYHGFGRSEGKPSEKNLYLDAEAAYDYLIRHKGFLPSQIVVMGSSLGGAVAIHLALQEKIGALILKSTFTSARDMAPRINPFYRWPIVWIRSKFDTIAKIDKIDVPVLIIHSKEDEIIPYQMGVALYEKAREPKKIILLEKGKHNDLISAPEYLRSLRQILGQGDGF
jgi:fermentation-respiration switch protein FrsA (DUF1100 family)